MKHFTHRTYAILLAILLLLFALPTLALGSEADAAPGVYEGETDANGLRSGFGKWTYHNYVYEGLWANDLPNGEGTLYMNEVWGGDTGSHLTRGAIRGNWVDGLAHGMIEELYAESTGEITTYRHTLDMGFTTEVEVTSDSGDTSFHRSEPFLIGGVPPWANVWTDESLPTPSADLVLDPEEAAEWAVLLNDPVTQGFHPNMELTYQIVDDTAIITGYRFTGEDAFDHLALPSTLEGYPVTAIIDYAFSFCWQVLESITVPEGVTYIGEGAFSECPNITRITLPDSLQVVGDGAFAGSSNLSEFDLPAGVFQRGEGLFAASAPRYGDASFGSEDDSTWDNTPAIGGGQEFYEGETDANGLRSGYGTWIYHNFRYDGYWENDMPNGEGVLYQALDDHTEFISVTRGTFTDGLANGEVTYYHLENYSNTWDGPYYSHLSPNQTERRAHRFQVENGYPLKDETLLDRTEQQTPVEIHADDLLAGVPPWADVSVNPAPPPRGTNYDTDVRGRLMGEYGSNLSFYTYQSLSRFTIRDGSVYYSSSGNSQNAGAIIGGDGSFAEIMTENYAFYGAPWNWYGGETDAVVYPVDMHRISGRLVYLECRDEGTGYPDWLYRFISVDDNTHYTGMNVVKDLGKGAYKIHFVDEEWIYYTVSTKDIYAMSDTTLRRVKLDGSEDSDVIPDEETTSAGGLDVAFVGEYTYYLDNWDNSITRRRLDGGGKKGAGEVLIPAEYATMYDIAALGDSLYFLCDGLLYMGMSDSPFLNTGDVYIGKLSFADAIPGTPVEELFAKTQRYPVAKQPLNTMNYAINLYAAYDWLYLQLEAADSGAVPEELIMIRSDFSEEKRVGDLLSPADRSPDYVETAERISEKAAAEAPPAVTAMTLETQWEEWQAPTPVGSTVDAGMEITAGNRAMRGYAYNMADIGEWIYLTGRQKDLYALYAMSADGSRLMKLRDLKANESPVPFQIADGSLYAGSFIEAPDILALKAQLPGASEAGTAPSAPLTFGEADEQYPPMNRFGDWVYASDIIRRTNGDFRTKIQRTRPDGSDATTLALIEKHETHAYMPEQFLFADEEWVYVLLNWYENMGNEQFGNYTVDVYKIKNDGSGEAKIFRLPPQFYDVTPPHIAGDRLYYLIRVDDPQGTQIKSIDLDFATAPLTVVPDAFRRLAISFQATEDALYYGELYSAGANIVAALSKANLDGSNPQVLVDNWGTGLYHFSIAGDWIMFPGTDKKANTSYLVRLDGSGFHKLGDPYVPDDAPGTLDSTGKWRYELLPDGTAKLLGAGSKLKFSGKLALPAKVDKIPVTAIGESAFYGYTAFTGVTIPKGVTEIGDYAFFLCQGLTSVTIPEGVTHIGNGAFEGCEKLKKLTLPASLVSVGNEPFAGCDALTLSVVKKSESFQIVDGELVAK